MADHRAVRSASRRKTPTPQSPIKPQTPQAGRASRTRGLRSASRDIDSMVEAKKPTRRSARQASVTSVTDESDFEGHGVRSTRRMTSKAMGDLTMVEEVDTQIEVDEVPHTPTLTQPESTMPFRSPGAASEMSGTTAISSFSMVEAEFLEPRYILKHLTKLCNSAQEFLEHLTPQKGSMRDDLRNIQEIQKPDSLFTEDYRDFNNEFLFYVSHFRSEGSTYIHVRALHRSLFGMNHEVVAIQTGLDLVLYLANLLICAKQMIHSDRNEKEIWDALRQLDNTFPSQFVRSLTLDEQGLLTMGESALLDETFELALDLRTHLAILVLQRSASDSSFDPDDVLREVFFRAELSQLADGAILRGWNTSAFGGEDDALPPQFQDRVVERIGKIRTSLLDDNASQDIATIDLENLNLKFPWEATILRLLQWVRLRSGEIRSAIYEIGGPATILSNVKQEIERPQPVLEQEMEHIVQPSPRRKRRSFGRDRRRSSRKFDPNAPVDIRAIDALKARERRSGSEPSKEVQKEPEDHPKVLLPIGDAQQDDYDAEPLFVGDEEPIEEIISVEEAQDEVDGQSDVPELIEQDEEENRLNGPPTSSAGILKALKSVSKPGKENKTGSLFARQNNAVRVEFGDGFDSQPTPGPSNLDKGKQRAQPSPSRKRARQVELNLDSEDDDFEIEDRSANVRERREKAPVAKKVRLDPSSSAIPPSHQPPLGSSRNIDDDYIPPPPQEDASISEGDAPDMTETVPPLERQASVPPPGSYAAQHRLALQNSNIDSTQRDRKPRTAWSNAEQEAFVEYMSMFPMKYSAILNYDKSEGGHILQDRSQVNLKDKARTMAINMIKSGTGLKAGFENVIKPTTADGKKLLAQDYRW